MILIAQHSKQILSVKDNSNKNGALAVQLKNINKPYQQYTLKKHNNGIYSIVTFSGKCLDVYGGGKQNGANIIQVFKILTCSGNVMEEKINNGYSAKLVQSNQKRIQRKVEKVNQLLFLCIDIGNLM